MTTVLSTCPDCGATLLQTDLACSSCRRLVHSDELKRLASEAQQRIDAGDLMAARDAWKTALQLLPSGTVQQAAVAERLRGIEQRIVQSASERTSFGKWKGVAILGPLALFLLTRASSSCWDSPT